MLEAKSSRVMAEVVARYEVLCERERFALAHRALPRTFAVPKKNRLVLPIQRGSSTPTEEAIRDISKRRVQ